MPVDLEARCRRYLEEIVTLTHTIRCSTLASANRQNFDVSEKLRRTLETIRISADTILEAMTKASLTDLSLDDRIMDWLLSREPRSCLEKLKKMDKMLKPSTSQDRLTRVPTRPFRPVDDKLAAAMTFLDKHNSIFHFLITTDVWDQESLFHRQSGSESHQADIPEAQMSTGNDTATDHEHAHDADQCPTRRQGWFNNQKLDEVSRWLAALDCKEKHKHTLQLRREGTCGWFPKTEAYKKWRTGGVQLLWLQGKAGCGKSVLAASTIEHLKNTLENEVLIFFYCDFQNKRSTSCAEVMRSLLTQLAHHMCDSGIDPGELPNKILNAKTKGTLSLDDPEKLCDEVSRAAILFPREPIVVIDALDECMDVEVLLRALLILNRGDVRLLVTSRPDPMIMHHFSGFPSLSFKNVAEELAEDIALHVRQEIDLHDRLRSTDPEMKDEIRAKLNEKAEGRFRWVQCQLDALKRCESRQGLRKALDNLPTELEATYERILDAIDDRRGERELARRALVLLVAALEPLRLIQVVDVLSVDFLLPRRIAREPGWLGAKLLDALSSLVSYHEETDVVVLSHFSVKEFLLDRTALPAYQIVLHDAHTEAAQTCMRYISAFIKEGAYRGTTSPFGSWPMLSYILSSGFSHLAHVDQESKHILKALQSLGLDVYYHPTHWDLICELREEKLRWPYPPWPTSRHDFVLYILIAYSSVELMQTFLSDSHHVKQRPGTNPLVYAADLRKRKHAVALLAYGFDVNIRSLVVDDSRHATPLEVAIDLGEDVLVGEFLQKGSVVTPELLSAAICMPWYGSRVLAQLMQTDQFLEWAHEIGNEKLYRCVFSSARPNSGDRTQTDEDHVTLARRLREIGIDISADSQFGGELIERALFAAHTSMLEYLLPPDQPPPARFLLAASTGDTSETVSVVRFLLHRHVDTKVVSAGSRDTALHLAAMCPWEPRSLELIKMLVDAGCDPQVYNAQGETALSIAMQRDYLTVVAHLLSFDIPLPSNVLIFALQREWPPHIIESLLCKGAEVNSTASNGDTVLHLAILNYPESTCLALVKIFMDARSNPTKRNPRHETVLGAAVEHGYVTVVDHLLARNVPFPPDILPVALRCRSSLKMVELLIQNGADVKSTTPGGDTVLHLAVANYAESTCLELVKAFVNADCSPNTHNSTHKTVLDAAIGHGYVTVVDYLLSCNVSLPTNILPAVLQQGSSPQMVKSLLRKGANVRSTIPDGNTLLHLVVTKYAEPGCLDLVKTFIDADCDPHACNSRYKTVLGTAIEQGYVSVVEYLLACNVSLPTNILPALLQQKSSPKMVQFLVGKGVDVRATASDGKTALHLAVTNYTEATCLDLVKTFISANFNPRIHDSRHKTALDTAVERGYVSVVDYLLSCDTPLSSDVLLVALQQKSTSQMVELLLRNGADVNSTTPNGDTVLHLAIGNYAESTCLNLVEGFISAGCHLTAQNNRGKAALTTAVYRRYTSVVTRLLSCNVLPPGNILPIALQRKASLQTVHLLIRKGADVNTTTHFQDTVLHLAVANYNESECLDLFKIFIAAGCNPMARNFLGHSALVVALLRGYTFVVEYLLACDVSLPSDALMVALQTGATPQLVESLIQKGADVNSTTYDGDSIFHLAIANYVESTGLRLVKTFIDAGCNPSTCNSEGKTPLVLAIRRRYASVVRELLLSNYISCPPGVLSFALQRRSHPRMIQSLAGKCIHDQQLDWDAVAQLVHASYPENQRQQIIQILIPLRRQHTQRD